MTMGQSDYYKSGSWNFICEVCGRKFKATQMKKRWDGAIVCREDWEPRHPQDFVKGVKDNPSVPLSRPEPSDQFIPWFYTSTFQDFVTPVEAFSKNIEKFFGQISGSAGSTLNANTLNSLVLNGTSGTGIDTGDYITTSDTISFSTIRILSDTITTSESVSVHNFTPVSGSSAIGAQVLNSITLG